MISRLISLPKFTKKLILFLIDSFLIIFSLFLSFSVRLGYWYFPEGSLLIVVISAPIIAIPIFIRFGLYRLLIRYMSLKSLWSLVKAISLYAIIWGIVAFMSAIDGIPRSVILINWFFVLLFIGGIRMIAQFLIGNRYLKFANKKNIKNVLIYGAGSAGVQLLSALEHSSEYSVIGFVDDDKELQGRQIKGINIFISDNIGDLIKKNNVNSVLIAIPSSSKKERLEIINKLDGFSVEVRILPSVTKFVDGDLSFSDLREISIKDLLGRDAVLPYKNLLSKNITNKTILVTGAGGSIGSELCRQIVELSPKNLILYDFSEFALYSIEMELGELYDNKVEIISILGDINDLSRFSSVLKRFKVNTIYHAAAYKHVPIVELNNTEGVKNNIFGTLNCAQAAVSEKVQNFVLISTDKAVRPTNTMGATKRSAELILQALSTEQTITNFTMVRFGNVLGSSGSVIPLFKKQILKGGPVTVTDPNILRYFMTIPEAVELVIQAGALSNGGDVFVLEMGNPIRIYDLAVKMIRLSGLELKNDTNPNGDIEIRYTGLRPGEKLYEELLIGDNVSKTEHPLIMKAKENMIEWNELEFLLGSLKKAFDSSDIRKIRKLLKKIVPEFEPNSAIQDILLKK